MRAVVVPGKKSKYSGHACGQCRRRIKAGDVMLVHSYHAPSGRGLERRLSIYFHRECIQKIMDAAPLSEEEADELFEKLREKAERGELFE